MITDKTNTTGLSSMSTMLKIIAPLMLAIMLPDNQSEALMALLKLGRELGKKM